MGRLLFALDISVLFSTYALIRLLLLPQSQLSGVDRYRFICMLVVNVIVFFASILAYRLQQKYHKIMLLFATCFCIVLLMTLCEVISKNTSAISPSHLHITDTRMRHLEMTWISFYFATYVFSAVALLALGIYLAVKEIQITIQEHKVQNILDELIVRVTLQEVEGNEECAICLEGKQGDRKYVKTRVCSHYFHQQCIKRWIENSLSCPICRSSLSKAEEKKYIFS